MLEQDDTDKPLTKEQKQWMIQMALDYFEPSLGKIIQDERFKNEILLLMETDLDNPNNNKQKN